MSTRRLFVDQSLSVGMALHVDGDRAHYLGRVLRCRPGDEVSLFNGDGFEYLTQVKEIRKQTVTLVISSAGRPPVESPLAIRLIQGIARSDRMDTIVQKATELGVRRISTVLSEFSIVRLHGDRSGKRLRHWQRISRNACEQSGRTIPPRLDPPCELTRALQNSAGPASTRLLLQPDAAVPFDSIGRPADDLEVLIGPEGGFSDTEQSQAASAGFVAVSLGPRTLRTETAAIAALTLAQALWGDMTIQTPFRPAGPPR